MKGRAKTHDKDLTEGLISANSSFELLSQLMWGSDSLVSPACCSYDAGIWSGWQTSVTVIHAMSIFLCASFYNAGHTSDSINVPTCQTVIRNLMYNCMCGLDKVKSRITNALVNTTRSFTCWTSKMLWFCCREKNVYFESRWCGSQSEHFYDMKLEVFVIFTVFNEPDICNKALVDCSII